MDNPLLQVCENAEEKFSFYWNIYWKRCLYIKLFFFTAFTKNLKKVNSSRSFQRVEKCGLKIQIYDKMCYKVTTGLGHKHNKLQNRLSNV